MRALAPPAVKEIESAPEPVAAMTPLVPEMVRAAVLLTLIAPALLVATIEPELAKAGV